MSAPSRDQGGAAPGPGTASLGRRSGGRGHVCGWWLQLSPPNWGQAQLGALACSVPSRRQADVALTRGPPSQGATGSGAGGSQDLGPGDQGNVLEFVRGPGSVPPGSLPARSSLVLRPRSPRPLAPGPAAAVPDCSGLPRGLGPRKPNALFPLSLWPAAGAEAQRGAVALVRTCLTPRRRSGWGAREGAALKQSLRVTGWACSSDSNVMGRSLSSFL